MRIRRVDCWVWNHLRLYAILAWHWGLHGIRVVGAKGGLWPALLQSPVRIGVLQHHPPRPLAIPADYRRRPTTPPTLRIALVTPSYNQGRFLEQTLQSVFTQDYPHLQYGVQDGGSTDGSLDVLARHRSRLTHCQSARDRGQTHAINLGFRHVSGDIMAWLNSDDLLLPGALHYVADYFQRHPEVDVVYGHRVLIDEFGQEIGRWILPRHDDRMVQWADYIPQETMFWRRRLWDQVGAALDESFQFAMDWDLILRFRAAGARFERLPRFLGAFRVHPRQKTQEQQESVGAREVARLRERVHHRTVDATECYGQVRKYLGRHVLLHRLYQWGLVRY